MSDNSDSGYCHQCGGSNPRSATFCASCGARLAWATDTSTEPVLNTASIQEPQIVKSTTPFDVPWYLTTSGMRKAQQKHVEACLAELPNFSVSQKFVSVFPATGLLSRNYGLAVDEGSNQICIFRAHLLPRLNLEMMVYQGQHVLSAEVIQNGHSVTRTEASTAKIAARAMAGGLLLGPAGALIGGATAPTTSKTVQTMSGTNLQIQVNDMRSPFITIEFGYDLNKAKHWFGIVQVVIQRAVGR